MGDRYYLFTLTCPYKDCGKEQEEVYYAESSGVDTHICEHCGRECEIVQRFELKAPEDE